MMTDQAMIRKLTRELTKQIGMINIEEFDKSDIKKKLESILEDFTWLANGAFRICFVHKNQRYVLKIETPHSVKQFEHNKSEIENYYRLPRELRKYFVKPLAFGKDYVWLLMAKVKSYKELTRDETDQIAKRLNEIFEKTKVRVLDIHGSNVGELNGQPVIFDYASMKMEA